MFSGFVRVFKNDDPKAKQEAAEVEAKAKARSDGHSNIFENCHKNSEIRSLFRTGGVFCRLTEEAVEPPINTDYENLAKRVDQYRELERFGVENKMALRGLTNEDIRRSTAFRATYANMQADRIYHALPYGKIYLKMVMAFYSVSRLNFDRLFRYQLASVGLTALAATLFVSLWGPQETAAGLFSPEYLIGAAGIILLFVIGNSVLHTLYKDATHVNRTTITEKVSQRIFHLINAEQNCLSRISTDENSAAGDSEWKDRAEVWALAAIAFRWRVYMIKQFLDIAAHKILRRYIWLTDITIPLFASFSTLALGAAAFLAASPDDRLSGARAWLMGLAGSAEAVFFVCIVTFVAGVLTFFFWRAYPKETLNIIASRIGSFDAGVNTDTPIDVILHLVGRVSTAKNEGRRG